MLQSMVDSQVEAEGWEAPAEAALDRGSLHTALQARCCHRRDVSRLHVPMSFYAIVCRLVVPCLPLAIP